MPEDLSRAVTAVVNRLLEERGWSGRELARRAGLKPTAVAYKLSGDRGFDVDDLAVIAGALDTTASALLTEAESRL